MSLESWNALQEWLQGKSITDTPLPPVGQSLGLHTLAMHVEYLPGHGHLLQPHVMA
jgi:hypothetical protein